MKLLALSPCYFPTAEPASRMLATAQRVGLSVELYGVGKQMQTHAGDAQGTDLLELLRGRNDKFVLVCDCADVAFLAGEDEILEKFQTNFPTGMAVSAEDNCWPYIPLVVDVLSRANGYFKFLNWGMWCGEREYAIHVIEESIRLYRGQPIEPTVDVDNPQAWLAAMMAQGTGPAFDLDRNCVLFQSMAGMEPSLLEWKDKRACNVKTGTYPIAIHYNGDKSLVSYGEMVERLMA